MEIVGKLTAKTLGWDRATLQQATLHTTSPVLMATVVGIVSGLRQNVNDETGDITTGLKGNFRGVSTRAPMVDTGTKDANDVPIFAPVTDADGKAMLIEARSGVCYLPSGLQDMIEGAYSQAVERDPKATVSFGLDLYCLKDTNKAGYTFKAETKVAAEERDPLDMLMEQVRAPVALAAPEKLVDPAPTKPVPVKS